MHIYAGEVYDVMCVCHCNNVCPLAVIRGNRAIQPCKESEFLIINHFLSELKW